MAFSAERQRLRLRWLYGDQLGWSTHMVVLSETPPEGFGPERLAAGRRMLHERYGMPMAWTPPPANAATVHACRAVVAARTRSCLGERLKTGRPRELSGTSASRLIVARSPAARRRAPANPRHPTLWLARMGATMTWLVPAGLLLAAAALKVADRPGTAVALTAYGVPGRLAVPGWAALVAVEAVLAAGLAAGLEPAAYAAGIVLAGFLLVQVTALAQGNTGAPCGCFGSGGRLSRAAAGRTALLAAACAALPLLGPGPDVPLVLTAAVAAAVLVLAAGRRNAPRGALEVDGEGPPLGAWSPLASWFDDPGTTPAVAGDVRIALFASPGCALCRTVAPAADALVAAGVSVRRFDEAADPEAWAAARVPGAPFAVALGATGVVLAKGTVNDPRQLASVLDAARARRPAATGTSRRAFLSRAGGVAATAAGAGVLGAVVRPGEAEAYHFCGHIYTTDGCPHPTGLPRIDRRGLPLRALDGRAVDDLGRLIDTSGSPVDEDGVPLSDLEGRPLPAAPRTGVCQATGRANGFRVRTDGGWYRCCDGSVRKLVDCCATHRRRINGDRALKGYCYDGRRVFCVMYFQSTVPC